MKRGCPENPLLDDMRALPAPSFAAQESEALSPALQHILRECQRELAFQNAATDGEETAFEREELVYQIAERFGFELTGYERDLILARMEREESPFGILQQLAEDGAVSDIIVSSFTSIAVQHNRKNFATGIAFYSQENYEAFVERLLSRAGTTYSVRKPIADGMVGSSARVHAVHASIAHGGPYLTIRFNRFGKVSFADLEKNHMAPAEMLQYLRGILESGNTILISGEVGTGKTTLARALANTIPPDESILVIEDTAEISLDHPHVRYLQTREANNDGAGRVAPAECIHGGMRMAMNRILFGEIRSAEAAEAFIDVCASGHPGVTTIHARSALDTIGRLELFLGRAQPGASQLVVQQQIAHAVQVIVHVGICRRNQRRCVTEVIELSGVADGRLRQKPLFSCVPDADTPTWLVQNKLSSFRDQLESLANPVFLTDFPSRLSTAVMKSNGATATAPEVLQ